MITKNYTVTGIPKFQTANSIGEAVYLGRYLDIQRKRELGLEISSIQGKAVKQFHWNEQQLLLEFENNLFLKIEIINQVLDIRIVRYHSICTNRDLVFELSFDEIYPAGLQILWNPQGLANKYIGKNFIKLQISEHDAWLHFSYMHLLLHCTWYKIKESNSLLLSWIESE